jgi:hypothetical protein
MPLYMITRQVPGATQEDMDAAAWRAITCAFYFDRLKWHQSYWDKQAGVIRCIYEAPSAEEIIAHAERARIPCDQVQEVSIIAPEFYDGEMPELTSA